MTLNNEVPLIERISRWPNCEKALAFVLKTWGSSPRPVGSMMAINDSGKFEGSLSGGCVENSVIQEANEVIRSSIPKRLSYGISDDEAWAVGLPCGGIIEVLIVKVNKSDLEKLAGDMIPITLLANTVTGGIGFCTETKWLSTSPPNQKLWEHAKEVSKISKSTIVTVEDIEYFIRPFILPWRLILIGAVHIAQPLSTIATAAGFDVTIIDPRTNYANTDRFPNVKLLAKWPDTALNSLQLDYQSAVVTLSHDLKIDDEALEIAVKSPAFYIGALGSQHNHSNRIRRLSKKGHDINELHRIHGPVGLDIGGNDPSDIAVSILAQIICERNGQQNSVKNN